ncbi:ubiquitin-conjugating enzyme E2 22-like [Henckelia pumila]|uniref:ubiquitin-conjugating enzyme E2 22-like n=1 Tax=Henckelia pumila TaxID=405737 RepID=UPI003C6E6C97
MATNENLPPNVIKQLAKELKNLDETPPEGIKVGVNDDNFSVINADIEGPAGTPYENGVFRMKLILSHDFPQSPPKGYFLTKIFHPNIATNGEICVNALKKDWNPTLSLRHVLTVIRCLLIEPFPESALNEQAGKMLIDNYDEYAKYARLYTGLHALKPKPKSRSGTVSESTTKNMDQTNSSLKGVDPKNTVSGIVTPYPLTPKPGNVQDLPSVITSSNGTGVGESTAAPATQKKESGMNKVPADKKKIMDARKKSLKRL